MRTVASHRRILCMLIAWMVISLGCSLTFLDDEATPPPADVVDEVSGPPPTVQIISPTSGQQVMVGTDVEIRVLATDQRGVSRVQLSVGNRTSSTKSFPEAATTAEALLRWRPDREGTFELSVVAYRQLIASAPATVSLTVVGRGDPISNPASGQSALASIGGDCVGRVLIGNLRIRTGPGTSFPHEGNFALNEQLTVIGQNTDASWYRIRRVDGSEKWVINNAEWLEVTGNCGSLPVVN